MQRAKATIFIVACAGAYLAALVFSVGPYVFGTEQEAVQADQQSALNENTK